jgi:Na+-translocating ferredoxin:NAD+ oxidoreductase RnfG subunit
VSFGILMPVKSAFSRRLYTSTYRNIREKTKKNERKRKKEKKKDFVLPKVFKQK